MYWTLALILLFSVNISQGSGSSRSSRSSNAKVCTMSSEVVSISCGIHNSFVGFLFIDRHFWYICFVILFFRFAQRLAEHPLPRSLPESKLSDLAQRTDYEAFYNDTFLKGIYRVRVPGTTGHHKVKMVRKITANVSVLRLLRVNKPVASFN